MTKSFPRLLTVEQPSHIFLTDERTFIVRTRVSTEALVAANVGCCCLVNCWKADFVNWDNKDMLKESEEKGLSARVVPLPQF